MSNQTPNDSMDAANVPDSPRLLNQQVQYPNPDNPAPVNSAPVEPASSSPAPALQLSPTVNLPDFSADEANLERWAGQRQAAYASLDAALERHINEAVRTVAEFKRLAEAEAVRASRNFVVDRDNLRQEIGDLRDERTQLRSQIEETRRAAREEEERQAQVRAEREELDRELNWLRAQLDEARRSVQAAQLEEQESGGLGRLFGRKKSTPKEPPAIFQEYSAPAVFQRSAPASVPPSPAPNPEIVAPPEPFAPPKKDEPAEIFAAAAYPVPEQASAPVEQPIFIEVKEETAEQRDEPPLSAFAAYVPSPAPATAGEAGKVETIKTPASSPVIPVTPAALSSQAQEFPANPVTADLTEPAVLAAPEIPGPPPTSGRVRPGSAHAITSQTFAYLQELLMGEPPDPPMADVIQQAGFQEEISPSLSERMRTATTGSLRLGGPGNLEQTAGLPPRRGQTDQLGARPPKRRHTTGGLGALPVADIETAAPAPVANPVTVSEVVETPQSEPRSRRLQSSGETEKQQKVVLRELGLQLGLNDPMTPPALNSMSFANGYTPPSGAQYLADMLDEINANVSAIMPPMPEASLPTGRQPKKVVEPPPPISPDTNLDDYSIEVEPLRPTLQELLDAGEQEVAAINEDPTPPENPTPYIGKIGSDHPVHFQPGPTITPRPEPLAMLNQETDSGGQASQQPTPARAFRPLNIRPLRSQEAQEIHLPLSVMFPPLTNPTNIQQTYVTITNLQGRYTLPILQKTLRILVGVAQVVVTDFNQQTLLIEVMHRPNLNLAAQFTSLPDLPLRLVTESPDTLVFMQDSQ